MSKNAYQKPDIDIIEELTVQLLQTNQQLERANEKLRLSEKQRSEMFSNISHDLRAPAAALRSAVDCLREGVGDTALLLDIMDRRTAVLENLISQLHYLVSLDLPGFQLRRKPVELGAFIEEYIATQELNRKFSERQLDCALDPGVRWEPCIDPDAMLRVLDNLFENALRFTGPGDAIVLGCRSLPGGVEIYVRDTGVGIPADQLEAVFERTYKVSSSRTPGESEGSGLGLAIVRKIVELHGGRVWCESQPGQGSVFRISLPLVNEK